MPGKRRRRSRQADVERRDGRWTRGYIHIGQVTVYQRGRRWYLVFSMTRMLAAEALARVEKFTAFLPPASMSPSS